MPAEQNVEITKAKWMPCPKIETIHPGLDYMHDLDQLIIVKGQDATHEVIGKKNTGYTIFNSLGEKVFVAIQETRRGRFDLKIFNYYGNEVIQVKKPHRFCSNRVQVWAPPGNYAGSVESAATCHYTFLVKNYQGNVVLKIKATSLRQPVYDVLLEDDKVGIVKKTWQVRSVPNVDNFGVSFPAELDVGEKAVLLGGCFLIGYLKY